MQANQGDIAFAADARASFQAFRHVENFGVPDDIIALADSRRVDVGQDAPRRLDGDRSKVKSGRVLPVSLVFW